MVLELLGDGQSVDDSGQLTELERDVVTATCQDSDLGTGVLEQLSGLGAGRVCIGSRCPRHRDELSPLELMSLQALLVHAVELLRRLLLQRPGCLLSVAQASPRSFEQLLRLLLRSGLGAIGGLLSTGCNAGRGLLGGQQHGGGLPSEVLTLGLRVA